jgi:hypothetical protein
MSKNGTNTANAMRQLLIRIGFNLGLYWLLQLIFFKNQIPFPIVAAVAVTAVLCHCLIDLILPSEAPQVPKESLFDRKNLLNALHLTIGLTAGYFMAEYNRHQGRITLSVCAGITVFVFGGFVGGYGPIKLARDLRAFWQNRAEVQIQGSN